MLCTRFAYGAAHGAEARHRPRQRACPAAQSQSLRSGLAFNKMPPGPQLKCTRFSVVNFPGLVPKRNQVL